jgi:hypothetical protein
LGSVPEAAGYIRVRAREVVRCGLAGTASRCSWLSQRQEQQVQERALTILVDHFTQPMLRTQAVVVPLRRAA